MYASAHLDWYRYLGRQYEHAGEVKALSIRVDPGMFRYNLLFVIKFS